MAAKSSQGLIIQMEKGKPKGKCRKWKLRISLGRDPIITKTAAGARNLPMSEFTAEALRRRHAAQLALYGDSPNEFVAQTPEGPVMRPDTAVITGDYEKRVNPGSFSRW